MTESEKRAEADTRSEALSKEQNELLRSRMIASQFGNMVTIMMQSPHHKNIRLAELYRRLVPPLLINQFRIAEARKKDSGATLPVGLILWARVSDEVHQRLLAQLDKTFDLGPQDWRSGDNYWIIDAIGPDRFVAPLLSDLRERDFKGKAVHYRAKSLDGPEVRTLKEATSNKATADAAAASVAPANEAHDRDAKPEAASSPLNGQHATS